MFSLITMKLRVLFLLITLSLTLGPSVSAVDAQRELDQHCWSAVPFDIDTAQDVSLEGPGSINVFRVEVPSPGVLLTELSEVFGSVPRAFIELIGDDCRPLRAQDVTYVERVPGRSTMRVNTPGTYHLHISTSSEIDEGRYRLRIGFATAVPFTVSGSAAKEVEDWEEDDEGLTAGTPLPCVGSAEGFGEALLTIDEPGILAIEADGIDLSGFLEPLDHDSRTPFGPAPEILIRIEPGTYSLRWDVADAGFCGSSIVFYPVCGLANADDHGDTLACASDLALGLKSSGELGVADVDVFSFVLDSHTTIVVETSGEADTRLSLLDTEGRPLVADDDGGDRRGSRIEAGMCPGRYFVRVAGVGDSQGSYVLTPSTDSF